MLEIRPPFNFELSEDRTTARINGIALPDDASVRILVAGEWFEGELELRWNSPTVFANDLGHVLLVDAPHTLCIVDALAPASP